MDNTHFPGLHWSPDCHELERRASSTALEEDYFGKTNAHALAPLLSRVSAGPRSFGPIQLRALSRGPGQRADMPLSGRG